MLLTSAITFKWMILFIICVLFHSVDLVEDPRGNLIKYFVGSNGKFRKEDINIPPPSCVVVVQLTIFSVIGIDSREILELYGWFQASWNDSRLTWNPRDTSNVTDILLPKASLWVPDVGIWNSIVSEDVDFLQSGSLKLLQINHKGRVRAYSHFISKTPCPIYGFLYPFDTQTCRLMLGSVTSTFREFKLIFDKVDIGLTKVDHIGEWILKGYDVNTSAARDGLGGKQFVYNKLFIHLQRKPMYHILLVILPFSLLSMMAAVLFFLKGHSDRFNIAVAILLSMTLYIVIASQNAPKSMQRLPIMGIFLLNQMTLLILMTFMYTLYPFIAKLLHYSSETSNSGSAVASSNRLSNRRSKVCLSVVWATIYLSLTFLNALVFLYIVPRAQ